MNKFSFFSLFLFKSNFIGDAAAVESLIQHGANVNYAYENENTALDLVLLTAKEST